jgi:hypothetical protein
MWPTNPRMVPTLRVSMVGDVVGGQQFARDIAHKVADFASCPCEELALFALSAIARGAKRIGLGILRAVEPSGRVGHFASDIVEALLNDSTKERAARHLPGVDAQRTRAGCELSYSIFSECIAQSNTPGFPLTARLVLTSTRDRG